MDAYSQRTSTELAEGCCASPKSVSINDVGYSTIAARLVEVPRSLAKHRFRVGTGSERLVELVIRLGPSKLAPVG